MWFRRNISAVLGCALLAVMMISPVTCAAQIVYWEGEESCEDLFTTPLSQLPGGSYLTKIFDNDTLQAHYQTANGSTVKITIQPIKKLPVFGATYAAAYRDLVRRRPFQDRISRKASGHIVLADVVNLLGIRPAYKKTKSDHDDTEIYSINPQRLILELNARVRVAQWTEYDGASPEERRLWERHACTSYHHELGHILVAAQILEEASAEFLDLQAPSKEELETHIKALFKTVNEQIKQRQIAYHDALDEFGPSIGRARPYMEIPFPWLTTTNSQAEINPAIDVDLP